MIRLKNIYAGYGKKEILKGISLTINAGEIVSIIGPNGAGKSTLLKVIAGLLDPYRGEVIFRDKDITYLDCTQRVKKGIVYFLQGGEIFPGLTVRENLDIGANDNNGRNPGILNDIFKLFPDIKNMLNRRAGLLSGGQRQQVALAMVLLKQPVVLLLDEPSAGLAPYLVKETMQRVKEINKQFKTTIVLVEQNIYEALKVAKNAFVMLSGDIEIETYNPMELIDSGKLEGFLFGKIKVKQTLISL